MTKDQAIALAREAAFNYPQKAAYNYLPRNEVEAANWMPHGWVVNAIMKAAEGAVSATLESKPAQIEFGFFQAEQLLGQFGGDTDARMTVSVDAEGKMHAWPGEYPEEGAVELVDEP